MDIILLGAGTAVPIPDRSPAGVLLKSNGVNFLLDMGPGTIHRIAAQGEDPFLLQHIFLTHLHSDHTLDLVTFLQMNDSTPGRQRTSPLYLTGCYGVRGLYEGLMRVYPGISPTGYEIHIREVAEDRFNLGSLSISTALSGHTPESISYRFDSPEGSIVYTGDCSANASLEKLCSDADLLICECSFPAGWASDDHMNADSVGRLAANAGVKKLVATHLYPPAAQADLASQIGKYYHGQISIGRDGSTFTLKKRSG